MERAKGDLKGGDIPRGTRLRIAVTFRGKCVPSLQEQLERPDCGRARDIDG